MSGGGGGHGKGGGRKKKHEEEEHVNHERWLVSYADMLTVLMALFIVLFAISQVDQQKFIALRQSLSTGFSQSDASTSVMAGTDGILDGASYTAEEAANANTPQSMVDGDEGNGDQASNPTADAQPQPVDPQDLAAAEQEATHLEQIRDTISAALAAQGQDGAVRFSITDRGLVMGLVADDVFFASASAQLTPAADTVLDAAAPTLAALGNSVAVEGHANTIPVSGRYATNWELSADRATQVLRRLVEHDGFPGNRIQAVGFGDTKPLVEGDTPEALEANRRVDIVVLSDAPEAVRELIPTVENGH